MALTPSGLFAFLANFYPLLLCPTKTLEPSKVNRLASAVVAEVLAKLFRIPEQAPSPRE
jgi:hypothetical protein